MKREKISRTVLIASIILIISAAYLSDGQKIGTITLQGSENVSIEVEIADDEKELKRGLSHRTSLPENQGMLFIFPEERILTFWMKDTLIPLDIIFVNSNLRITDIHHADPEPGVPEEQLELYRSSSPAKYAIEVNQNFTEKHSIEEGDRIYFGSSVDLAVKESKD